MKTFRRSGFSLMEIAIVFAIVSLILGAVWQAAGKANEAQRSNAAAAELQMTAQNILSIMDGQIFSTAMITTGDITSTMIAAKSVPSAYLTSSTTMNTPWGTAFKIEAIAAKTMRISFAGVPTVGCVSLLLQGAACDASQVGCPFKAYTEGTTNSLTPNATTGWQTVMTTAAAETLCNAGAVNNANSVAFDYAL